MVGLLSQVADERRGLDVLIVVDFDCGIVEQVAAVGDVT